MPFETDVVIAGAGAAGLAAATELQRLGLSFQLLEGSHRIGGRAYSEEIAPGVWFDLGCSYLHQGEINPFVEIAHRLDRKIGIEHGDIFADEKIRFHRNGQPLDAAETAACLAYANRSDADIEAAADQGRDVAIAELIDLEHEFAKTYIEGVSGGFATDPDLISSIDYCAYADGSDYPVLDGYGNLVAAWARDVPVSLNCRVERIDYSGDGVTVDSAGGRLRARAAICSVSTGVLAADEIEFSPRLPDWKIDAIHGLPIGTMNKIGVHFDKDVFGSDGRGFHATWSDADEAGSFEASVMGQDVAIVFCSARFAVWLENQGPQAMTDFALNCIADVFGNDIRKSVSRSITTAWHGDPWTRGSYACALPGHGRQRVELAKAVAQRLFFAGEATAASDYTTCHGAYNSGLRAAREAAAAISAK